LRTSVRVYECGVPIPALRVARSPIELTARQREILTLARAGHSNSEIADILSVSVKPSRVISIARHVGTESTAAMPSWRHRSAVSELICFVPHRSTRHSCGQILCRRNFAEGSE
jgi:hypothetical protein